MTKSVSVKIGNGELILETGKMAKQANGAVYAHYEGSAVPCYCLLWERAE